MDARDTTANNADLWSCFLREQYRLWIDPFALNASSDEMARTLAEASAATISSALNALLGRPIDRLYADNAPDVSHFVEAVRNDLGEPVPDDVQIPEAYAAHHVDAALEHMAGSVSSAIGDAVLAY